MENISYITELEVTVIATIILIITSYQAKQGRAACVILATAMLWMTEALPLMISALIPVVMFPMVGIMDTKEVGFTLLLHKRFY